MDVCREGGISSEKERRRKTNREREKEKEKNKEERFRENVKVGELECALAGSCSL